MQPGDPAPISNGACVVVSHTRRGTSYRAVVAATSVRRNRRKNDYERWYKVTAMYNSADVRWVHAGRVAAVPRVIPYSPPAVPAPPVTPVPEPAKRKRVRSRGLELT